MSQDSVVLSAISAGPQHEAEYDAVYAAVTATERGRWFLTEFAHRNRYADTHLVVAAIARIEAAIRGDAAPRASATLWRDLTGLAAAIERIRAALVSEATPAPDIAGAVERIQDVSFTLRERGIDTALCDALDTAAREISDAFAPRKANGKPAAVPTAMLGDLAGRVDELIKLSLGGEVSKPTAVQPASQDLGRLPDQTTLAAMALQDERNTEIATDDDDELSRPNLFTRDIKEGDKIGAALAGLATSLKNAASAIDPRGEIAAAIVLPPDNPPPSHEPLRPEADGSPRWHIEAPDFLFNPLDAEADKEKAETSGMSAETHAQLPTTEWRPSPEDDSADLFEEMVAPAADTPTAAASVAAAAAAVPAAIANSRLLVEAPLSEIRVSNGPPARTAVRRSSGDTLAALRGLSEDELNALFG